MTLLGFLNSFLLRSLFLTSSLSLTRTPNEPSFVSPKTIGQTEAVNSQLTAMRWPPGYSESEIVRNSSSTFWPSDVRHSLRVTTRPRAGLSTPTHTIRPCPEPSDQKSAPSMSPPRLVTFMPTGITSPWQNHADL